MRKEKADWEIAIEKTNASLDKANTAIEKTNASLDKANVSLDKAHAAIEKTNLSLDKANKAIAELSKEVTRVSCTVNGIGDSNGIVAETFFEEATQKGITLKINNCDAFFEQTVTNWVIDDGRGHPKAEIDIFMTNCDYLLLIETKYRLDKKHTEKMLDKVKMLEKYRPGAIVGKGILTAFASLGAKRSLRNYFRAHGHFVFTEKNRKIQMDYPVLQK